MYANSYCWTAHVLFHQGIWSVKGTNFQRLDGSRLGLWSTEHVRILHLSLQVRTESPDQSWSCFNLTSCKQSHCSKGSSHLSPHRNRPSNFPWQGRCSKLWMLVLGNRSDGICLQRRLLSWLKKQTTWASVFLWCDLGLVLPAFPSKSSGTCLSHLLWLCSSSCCYREW